MSDGFTTAVATIVTAIITGVSTWAMSKPKDKKDAFQSLLDANTAFREEIRKDLFDAKKEITDLKQKLDESEIELSKLRKENSANQETIGALMHRCDNLVIENERLTEAARELTDVVNTLRNPQS